MFIGIMRDQCCDDVLTGSFNLRNKFVTYPVGQCFERDQIPWTVDNPGYPFGPVGLHKEIIDFYNYIKPTREEQFAREFVVSRIREVALGEWPDCQVDVFGSFKTGLYLPSSDIDMVIFGKWDVLPLRTLEEALLRKQISSEIKVLDKASVPIVKMTDKETDLRVDISFNMINSVRAAEHMRMFMNSYPALPYLVFVLKQYLLQRNLNEVWTGGLSSYALILMCISYLQHQIPPGVPVDRVNLGVMLIEFFELYGRRFNYINTAIRVTNGGEYVPKSVVQQNMEPGLRPSILCIEDPLCPGNDVGRRSYCALQVKQAFEYAYAVISFSVLPHYTYLHWQSDVSILGRVLKISKWSLEHRKRIRSYGLQLMATLAPNNSSGLSPITVTTCDEEEQSENGEAKPGDFTGIPFTADSTCASPGDDVGQSRRTTSSSVGDSLPATAAASPDPPALVHQQPSTPLEPVASDQRDGSGSDGESEVREDSVVCDAVRPSQESQQNDAEKPGDCTILANELASLSTYMVEGSGRSASPFAAPATAAEVPSSATASCSHGRLNHQDCKRRCLRPSRSNRTAIVSVATSSSVAVGCVEPVSPPLDSPYTTGVLLPVSPSCAAASQPPSRSGAQSRKQKSKQSEPTCAGERRPRHFTSPLVVSIKQKTTTGCNRSAEQQPSGAAATALVVAATPSALSRRQAARRFSRQHSALLEPDRATSGIY